MSEMEREPMTHWEKVEAARKTLRADRRRKNVEDKRKAEAIYRRTASRIFKSDPTP